MAGLARVMWATLAVIFGVMAGWAVMAYFWNTWITGPL